MGRFYLHRMLSFPALARIAPVLALLGLTIVAAWPNRGSVAAADWLALAVFVALLTGTVLAVGAAARPSSVALLAFGTLMALAVWIALSALWSPVPSLARDEALLLSLYGLCLIVPPLALKSRVDVEIVVAATALVLGGLAVAAAVTIRLDADPRDAYELGRLAFPISYANAQAAVFLLGFWPAIATAATRHFSIAVRAAGAAAAAGVVAGWLLTQSKGAGIALCLSAVVVFAVSPHRLRLLPAVAIATAACVPFVTKLTSAYGARDTPELGSAIHEAAEAVLIAVALAAIGGALLALVDRRIAVGPRGRRVAGAAALTALVLGLGVAGAASAARVDDPDEFLAKKWDAFKATSTTREDTSTHLLSLGSNRYDFWRVAFDGALEHPVAGAGGRAFGTIYLIEGRSPETPRRAHSLPLDTLLETGVIGGLLLLAAFVLVAMPVVRASRRSVTGAAVLGGGAYFIVHASGDWITTFPAVGIPAFMLLGTSLVVDDPAPLGRATARAGAAAAAAAGVLAFAPPWLSERLTTQALVSTGDGSSELTWARRLDPLSIDPVLARATLADDREAKVDALRDAVELEPRNPVVRERLARALLAAGQRPEARKELQLARSLNPRDPRLAAALADVR